MQEIRLMADYFCYPLWRHDGELVGDIDPRSLPLSKEITKKLLTWADDFDALYNADDPAGSGFDTFEAMAEFDARGEQLWQQLQKELQGKYRVVYKPFRGELLEA